MYTPILYRQKFTEYDNQLCPSRPHIPPSISIRPLPSISQQSSSVFYISICSLRHTHSHARCLYCLQVSPNMSYPPKRPDDSFDADDMTVWWLQRLGIDRQPGPSSGTPGSDPPTSALSVRDRVRRFEQQTETETPRDGRRNGIVGTLHRVNAQRRPSPLIEGDTASNAHGEDDGDGFQSPDGPASSPMHRISEVTNGNMALYGNLDREQDQGMLLLRPILAGLC